MATAQPPVVANAERELFLNALIGQEYVIRFFAKELDQAIHSLHQTIGNKPNITNWQQLEAEVKTYHIKKSVFTGSFPRNRNTAFRDVQNDPYELIKVSVLSISDLL